MKNSALSATALAAIVSMSVLAACHRDAEVTAPVVVSTISVATNESAEEVSASGVIEAVNQAHVGFMVPGRVLEILVEDGASVAAGQLLARIDDSDLRNEVAIADARLAEISARHERLTKLHELGSLTVTDFEKSTASLRETESAAALAHRRLGYAELHAPFAGQIVRTGIGVGSVVAPGQPVCKVLGPAPVWATLSVPEVDAPRVRTGQDAKVALAASDSSAVEGRVEAILPQADALTRSFAVKIRLANEDGHFRPGNVVTAQIATGRQSAGIVIPPGVVQRYADGALYVWVVEPARQVVTRRIITIGHASGTGVQVRSGLNPGDRIVESGPTALFDGMGVEVKP